MVFDFEKLEKEIAEHEKRIEKDKRLIPKTEAYRKKQYAHLKRFIKKDVDIESLL